MIALNLIIFGFYYVWNMAVSSIRLLIDTLNPSLPLSPGIIKIPVSFKNNRQYMAFFTLVTMTPGSLSIEYSEDKTFLYVHSLYLDDEEKLLKEMRMLESDIKRIFR